MNGKLKLGQAKTGAVVGAVFKVSKAFCLASVHTKNRSFRFIQDGVLLSDKNYGSFVDSLILSLGVIVHPSLI